MLPRRCLWFAIVLFSQVNADDVPQVLEKNIIVELSNVPSVSIDPLTKQARINFVTELQSRISQAALTYYPNGLPQSKRDRQVVFELTLRTDGQLLDSKLLISSGDKAMDAAILRIIFLAAPYSTLSVDANIVGDSFRLISNLTAVASDTAALRFQSAELVEWGYSGRAPSGTVLHQREEQIARLNAELNYKMEQHASLRQSKPREYKFAEYVSGWTDKIQRTMNASLSNKASGWAVTSDLLLDTAIRFDGTIIEITIRRSSGNPSVDQAVRKIVFDSAPFKPFPSSLKDDFDVIHITRTWHFLEDGQVELK